MNPCDPIEEMAVSNEKEIHTQQPLLCYAWAEKAEVESDCPTLRLEKHLSEKCRSLSRK